MIYLDNAATTYIKPSDSYKKIKFCLRKCGGNPGRSSHRLSYAASELIYNTREAVSEHLGICEPERVVFTYNATHALNLAIKAFITKKCHIIISDIEHNSVIRPIEELRRRLGIEYSIFNSDYSPLETIPHMIRSDTVGIISTLASNVTGKRVNLNELSSVANKHNLFLIVDASQYIGHSKINLENSPCDVLCAPSHKSLFGIQGSGFAVFKNCERKNTLIEGGSGYDSKNLFMPMELPEGYEAGTPATPAIASLLGGLQFIKRVGIEEIENKIFNMEQKLYERIASISNIDVLGHDSGILSFAIKNVSSSEITTLLDMRGICVRGGLHCAPSVHRKLGTDEYGAVRVSLSYFNNENELDILYKAMLEISKEITM